MANSIQIFHINDILLRRGMLILALISCLLNFPATALVTGCPDFAVEPPRLHNANVVSAVGLSKSGFGGVAVSLPVAALHGIWGMAVGLTEWIHVGCGSRLW